MSKIVKKNLKIILAITNSNQKNKYYIWQMKKLKRDEIKKK
jgi:hypothetical protein